MCDLISVIIPAYNVKSYLRRCMESVLNQSYSNLEIILVDDGSTDGTAELCDSFAVTNNVKVIHKKNGGLSDARNAGLDIAKGKYVSFVDSDDWIASNMIEELYSAIKINNVKLSVCETTFAYDKYNYSPSVSGNTFVLKKMPAYELLLKNRRFRTNAWNKLYSLDLWKKIRFPVNRKYEDVFVMHKIYDMCDRIAFVDKNLYFYYQRSNSIVHVSDISADYDLLKGTIERYEYLRKYPSLMVLSNASVVSAALTLYRNSGLHHTKLSEHDHQKLDNEIKVHFKEIRLRDLSPRLMSEYILYRISPDLLMTLEPLMEKLYLMIRRN